jgi:hypothetical protein
LYRKRAAARGAAAAVVCALLEWQQEDSGLAGKGADMKAPTGLLVIVLVVAALAVAGCSSSPATTSTVGSIHAVGSTGQDSTTAENGNTPPSVAPPYTVTPVGLSAEERQQLDSLDAPGVIRTYFETADPRVVYYLSAPHEQAMMTAPNYVGEQRHEGDIANLTLDGPTGIDPLLDAYPRTDWPIQEQFVVEYDLLVAREQSAQEAGPQLRFVYVGKQTPDSPWRVMGAGTGP